VGITDVCHPLDQLAVFVFVPESVGPAMVS